MIYLPAAARSGPLRKRHFYQFKVLGGDTFFVVLTVQKNAAPAVTVTGATVALGQRQLTLPDEAISIAEQVAPSVR